MECRKRSIDETVVESAKRPKYAWYFKLESESSCASQEDAESIYSYQNLETDEARDTSDTDTKTDCTETDLEVEYEIASTSEDDEHCFNDSSGTDDALATAGAIAAAICNSSLEAWATDAEDSDSSSLDETSFGRTDFWTCVQCKSQNDNPLFRYCEQCYQVRKTLFPPRPRRNRRVKKVQQTVPKEEPVKLESLQSCLNGLSQDSGIGSSQEFPALQLDKIVVPKHLTEPEAPKETRKRQLSESSISDFEEIKRFKPNGKHKSSTGQTKIEEQPKDSRLLEETNERTLDKTDVIESGSKLGTRKLNGEKTGEVSATKRTDTQELCIICNICPKNSIFLHGNIAHRCCCYKCAIRTWGLNKRCPACNCKVKNVVKVFTI